MLCSLLPLGFRLCGIPIVTWGRPGRKGQFACPNTAKAPEPRARGRRGDEALAGAVVGMGIVGDMAAVLQGVDGGHLLWGQGKVENIQVFGDAAGGN